MTKTKRQINYGNAFSIVVAHAGAIFAVYYGIKYGFSWEMWACCGLLFCYSMFGVTVGYHRMLTHRGLQCGPILRFLLSVGGGVAAQGPEYTWVANHRVHHFFSDREFDPHSPLEYPGWKGLLWAHMGWLFFRYNRPPQYKQFRDLDQDRMVTFQRTYYLPIVLLGFVIPWMLFGLPGLLLCGFLRLVASWHVSWSVNSVCHKWGGRATDVEGRVFRKDDSRNNIVIGVLGMGEGYHSNHHARPSWVFHGWNWYDIDASKWLILTFEKLGWFWGLKKPAPVIRFEELDPAMVAAS